MEQDFRWVKAQQSCSACEVFKILQSGCAQDVEDRQETRKPREPVGFKLVAQNDRFLVLREGDRISSSVLFRWSDAGITVCDENLAVMLEATPTVNDEGECRLRVGKEELNLWQFRKRALQDLFFNYAF